jgi:hypothetical protein
VVLSIHSPYKIGLFLQSSWRVFGTR